jgi:hypothetical protein
MGDVVNIKNSGRVWVCDVCKEPILTVEDGYIVWKNNDTMQPHSFRIVHKNKCDKDNSFSSSSALADLIGDDGLNKMLSFLSIGVVAVNMGNGSDHSKHGPVSMTEYVDLFRRLHLPNYEEVRPLFNDPSYLDRMNGANEIYPYTQQVLQSAKEDD